MNEKRVGIIGVGMTEITREKKKSALDLAVEAMKKAISDAGIEKKDIQGIFLTPEGFMRRCAKIRGGRIADYLQLPLESATSVECGGVSSMQAVKYAMNEILLGYNDINMVLVTEVEKYNLREEGDYNQIIDINSIYSPYDSPYGVIAATLYYALATQRYMEEYKIKPEQIANVCVVLRENAAKNPYALYKKPLTVEEVLNSRMIVPPIHLFEAPQMADAAAAIILAREEIAKKICKKPVFITGVGEYHDNTHLIQRLKSMSSFPALPLATKRALNNSGRKLEDINVAEIYGAFASFELITYEEMGFFKKGEAAKAVEDGLTKINGKIPMNTSGGRLSLGHPPYVTPLLEIIEIVLQLRGEAGERQVKDAKIGLAQSEHGVVNGAMVMILEN